MFLLFASVAFAEPNVVVVDTKGEPIKDAAVEQITASMNLGSKLTDEDGMVEIPKRSIQKTEWISVTKTGYVSSGHIKFDQPKPIKVTLTPEPKKPENKAEEPTPNPPSD